MATDIETVRLLMGDCESVYDNTQIQIFIDESKIAGAVNTKWAAALALEACANSKALKEKLRKTLNYTGDNKGLSKSLRDGATALREADAKSPYAVDVPQTGTEFATLDHQDNLAREAGFGS